MPPPTALALYTLRDALQRDFAGTMQAVADLGYVGVEPAGTKGVTPQAAGRVFRDLGLVVCSVHAPLPVGDKQNEVLDTLAALDCRRVICASQPAELFQSLDGLQQVCDTLNEANAVCLAHGLTLGYHNHWWEFGEIDGQPAHTRLRKGLHPQVFFEIDTYWARVAGADPAGLLHDLGARVPLVHLKDGPGVRGQPQVALGDGVMDVPAVVAAAGDNAEWLIVELDEFAGDMFDAVRRSYRYLVDKGLARGRA